jgi:hypothetical protein
VALVTRLANEKAISTVLRLLIAGILYNYKKAFRTTGQIG